jgi:hypothetical protein
MIHPSTMAGPNLFTAGFGTTNPFQQNNSPFFRNNPFQGGFGPGNNPFQGQAFGLGNQNAQIQNTVNEILRQSLPSIIASYNGLQNGTSQTPFTFGTPFGSQGQFGFQSSLNPQSTFGLQNAFNPQGTLGFQSAFGPQGQFGLQNPFVGQTQFGTTPYGNTFQTGFGDQNPLQNPNTFNQLVQQATNTTLQCLNQQIPGLISQGLTGQTQGNIQNTVAQVCQAVASCCCYCVAACLTPVYQGQNPQAFVSFVVQACTTVALACCLCTAQALLSSNQTQGVPFNLNTNSPFGTPIGIPTGVGAF